MALASNNNNSKPTKKMLILKLKSYKFSPLVFFVVGYDFSKQKAYYCALVLAWLSFCWAINSCLSVSNPFGKILVLRTHMCGGWAQAPSLCVQCAKKVCFFYYNCRMIFAAATIGTEHKSHDDKVEMLFGLNSCM